MRLRSFSPALALGLLASLVAPVTAAAQDASGSILVFQTQLRGEIADGDSGALRDALHAGLAADGRLEVLTESDTAEILGPDAICADAECAVAAGAATGALLGVAADVYAEAEIYDFTVRVFRLSDGEILAEQPGECTFCPLAEAVESLRFTAESTLDSIETMPTAPVAVATASATDGDAAPADPEDAAGADGDAADSTAAEDNATAQQTTPPAVVRPPREPREPREPRPAATDSRFTQQAVGGITAGVGTAVLIGGIVALAFDGKTNCSEGPVSACPELYETTAGGIALTAIGGIAIGTGIGLIVTGRSAADDGVEVSVTPYRGGGFVRLNARF